MTLKERLSDDLHQAMRSHDDDRKRTVRLVLAAVRNAEIATGHALDDAGVTEVLKREVKQRRDSIDEFGRANRADLVAREQAELEILRGYLPRVLERSEIEQAAREVIAEVAAHGPRDKGKVMGPLLKQLAGTADGRDVNDVVTALLAGG